VVPMLASESAAYGILEFELILHKILPHNPQAAHGFVIPPQDENPDRSQRDLA
jgi:hypothetical protein